MILQNSGDSLANSGILTLQDSIVPLITGQVSGKFCPELR